ncbi:hypothetical protein F5Y05DRAFT_395764 [Hypoxylon sp. FL0543]|nr:hypothetical protein F5Y05DRAFT_395764 [Hypoxylon sp. FL0543]
MTYTVVAHIRRKQNITPSQFRTHYDTVHVPLLKSLVGPAFPLTHTRYYVTRKPTIPRSITSSETLSSENVAESDFLPVIYWGEASRVEYDSLTVMVWEDYTAFECFMKIFSTPDVFGKIFEDEKNFRDQSFRRVYALEQPITTERD